jgi:methyl-accepting chemotaxis protein
VICGGLLLLLLLRLLSGADPLPFGVFVGPLIFLVYGIVVFFVSPRAPGANPFFAALDMLLISLCVFFGGAQNSPLFLDISFFALVLLLSLWALCRDTKVQITATIFAVLGYLLSTLSFRESLGPDFFKALLGTAVLAALGVLMVLGIRRLDTIVNEFSQKEKRSASDTGLVFSKTLGMVKTIQESAQAISLCSKDNFTTANNQAASMEEIKTTINDNVQIATEISDKTGSVANIASKMENDVITGFSVLEKNVKKMGDIKEKNSGVINGIVSLGNKITKIRDIVRVINTITDQTKVIAFNAALEAASAGETGKRFAVVAGEVNRLADDIAGLTRQIREQVEEIQTSSSSLIISSEEGSDRIAEGYKLIKDLEDIFKEIRSGAEITANQAQTITVSTQKQRKSSEQINIAIADISQGLHKCISAAEGAASSAEGLTGLSKDLEAILHGN